MGKMLIEGGAILTMDGNGTLHHPGYVWIEDDRIGALGAGDAPSALRRRAGRVIDAGQMAVIPGLVNAHTHLFQTFLRGLADDKPLLAWLESAIWPAAQALTPEDAYQAARLGLVENIRSGVTTVVDHHYIHTDPQNDDAVCRAAQEMGTRLLLARGWTDTGYHPAFMETPDQIFAEMARLNATWHGSAQGRIRIQSGPLIPWGCTDETMRRAYCQAQAWGVGTMIHVAETRAEVELTRERRGRRDVEWLAHLQTLGPDVQLVHGVWLDDHELDLVAQSGAVVVHCPVANMYLASGIARIPEMRRRGIPVALATDGPGSNNNQDMFQVLKLAALSGKVSTLDATALLPEDVLWMACRGGALSSGQADLIGSLEVGKRADIVLVDLESPFAAPVHRVASALVYSLTTASVDTVIVDGRLLMHGRELLCVDESAVIREAHEACAGLFRRAGIVA